MFRSTLMILAALSGLVGSLAQAATPAEILESYSAGAAMPPMPERGRLLFNTNFGKTMGLSCSSCHGAVPTKMSTDVVTEKRIAPLAPAFNDKRFRDKSRVEFMFKLNCKDVVGRECTALEKADVLAWLISLQP